MPGNWDFFTKCFHGYPKTIKYAERPGIFENSLKMVSPKIRVKTIVGSGHFEILLFTLRKT